MERIGYRMLYDVLTTITEPNEQFVEALIELIVESPEKDLSHLVVANPAAAVTVLDYAAVLKAPELQLLIISRVIDLLNKRMHSRIQCASQGMLNAILRLFKSSPQLRPDVADSLVRLFEILAAHSINPGELKELFQLLCKDEDGFQPDYATKLLHSISCIANDTSNKNPFRYFDIQGDHDVSFPKHTQKATFRKIKNFAFSLSFSSFVPASLNHSPILYHYFNLIFFFSSHFSIAQSFSVPQINCTSLCFAVLYEDQKVKDVQFFISFIGILFCDCNSFHEDILFHFVF